MTVNRLSLKNESEVFDLIAMLEREIREDHDTTLDPEADEEEKEEAARCMDVALEFLDRLGYDHPLLENEPEAGVAYDWSCIEADVVEVEAEPILQESGDHEDRP